MDGSSSEGKGLGRGRLPCQSGRGRLEEFTGTRLVPRLMRQRRRVKTELRRPEGGDWISRLRASDISVAEEWMIQMKQAGVVPAPRNRQHECVVWRVKNQKN
jgi:hypothetical protein